jgi:WD40 repeat protein/serine/threonine protein kinase
LIQTHEAPMSAIPSTAPFPDDDDGQDDFNEAVLNYEQAIEEGVVPDTEEFVARFPPQYADQIRKHIATRKRFIPPGTTEKSLPRKLRDFKDVERIGIGGMGVVYIARHLTGDHLVALKTLRYRSPSTGDAQRLISEFRHAAKLNHPHIVHCYDVGWHEGVPFFSMEWVEGGTLAKRLDEFRLPKCGKRSGRDQKGVVWSSAKLRKRQVDIALLIETVARAVHYAHQRGTLHRDLKPSNILFDKEGRPKVSDFGLAKRLKDPSSALDTISVDGASRATEAPKDLTGSEGIVGTLGYMAPEQAAGEKDLSTAADVYSLGAVLYQLLVGRPPLVGTTIKEYQELAQNSAPARPRTSNSRIDRDLEAICMKCLEKEAAKRYDSAEALANDLRRYVESRPTRARPVRFPERMRKWVRRRPAIAALTLAVAMLSALSLAMVIKAYYEGKIQQEHRERLLYVLLLNSAKGDIEDSQINLAEDSLAGCPESRRGEWEWRLLKASCLRRRIVLRGHSADVNTVHWRRDGTQLVTASSDSTAIIWDAASGKIVHTLAEHQGWVTSACFGCNDKYVFTAGNDRRVLVWDPDSGKKVRELTGLGTYVAAAACSNRVAILEEARKVSVLDSESGDCCYELDNSDVIEIALSPDGRYLAVAGYNKLIEVHDINKRSLLHSYTFEEGEIGANNVWHVAFSPDAERIAAGTNVLREWNVLTAQRTNQFSASGDYIALCFSYSNDGRVAVADRSGFAHIWDCSTRKSLFTRGGHAGIVSFVAFSPTDSRFLAVSHGKYVSVEDLSAQPIFRVLEADTRGPIGAIGFDSTGNSLLGRVGENGLAAWDLGTGNCKTLPSLAGGKLSENANLAVSPDSPPCVVCGGTGDKLPAWTVASGEQNESLGIPLRDTCCSAFSSDGQFLAVSDKQKIIHLWDRNAGRKRTAWRASSEILTMAFRPGVPSILAVGYKSGTVDLWDVVQLEKTRSIIGADLKLCSSIAFSGDGRYLATAGGNGLVSIWDPKTGNLIRVLRGHSAYVTCVAFSPDGRRLASCGQDGTVVLWDAETGDKLLKLLDVPCSVAAVAFSPDGNRLVCSGSDGKLRVWDARLPDDLDLP